MFYAKLLGLLPAIVFGVAACAFVPATSLLKLGGLDMLTVDPGQIRVAVSMVEALSVREGGVALETGVRLSASGPADSERFILQEKISVGNKPGLPGENSNISVFSVAEEDLERLRALQKRIATTWTDF